MRLLQMRSVAAEKPLTSGVPASVHQPDHHIPEAPVHEIALHFLDGCALSGLHSQPLMLNGEKNNFHLFG